MTEEQKARRREAVRRWTARNKAKKAAANRQWRARNAEKVKKQLDEWHTSNPDAWAAAQKAWKDANRDRLNQFAREARKRKCEAAAQSELIAAIKNIEIAIKAAQETRECT